MRAIAEIEPEKFALDSAQQKAHTIWYSTEILKEYLARTRSVGISGYVLERKLREIARSHNFRKITKTNLDNASELIRERNCRLCRDAFDHKFIKAAIAARAQYVVTKDRGLRDLNPYSCAGHCIDFIEPARYSQ